MGMLRRTKNPHTYQSADNIHHSAFSLNFLHYLVRFRKVSPSSTKVTSTAPVPIMEPKIGGVPHEIYLREPDGQPAGDSDPIMVLAKWVAALESRGQKIRHRAGMGKPSYPIPPDFLAELEDNVKQVKTNAKKSRNLLKKHYQSAAKRRDKIAELNPVFDYEHPQGIEEARIIAAEALSTWYRTPITKEEVLFVTGGAGGLYDIFTVLNKKTPQGRIITPFPYYSLYATVGSQMNNLHPVHVMQEEGYKLTAESLRASIKSAKEKAQKDGHPISAFLFCDPNNPLGTVVSKEEWQKIAEVLQNEPDVPIILDSAYAGMVFAPKQPVTLLDVADEALKKRIVIVHSLTKMGSASGLRGAVVVGFDPKLMASIQQTNIDISGHAVSILQKPLAKAFAAFNNKKELKQFVAHYQPQVELVHQRLKNMGAGMPQEAYKPEGTFYAVGDFSDLLGTELFPAAQEALGKKPFITSSEDITYDFLFRNRVMIAPLQYYGLKTKTHAFMRITCSGGDKMLNELMDILSARLLEVRKQKIDKLLEETQVLIKELGFTAVSPILIDGLKEKKEAILKMDMSNLSGDAHAAKAKQVLMSLKELKTEINSLLREHHPHIRADYQKKQALICDKIYNFVKRKNTPTAIELEWKNFVDKNEDPADREKYYRYNALERENAPGWKKHLKDAPIPVFNTSSSIKSI